MNNSKSNFYKKTVLLILSIITIVSVLSGCTLSGKMYADLGFVDNREVYYDYTQSYDTNSLIYTNYENNTSQEYHYDDSFLKPKNVDATLIDKITKEAEGIFISCISSNFAIIVYKLDLMHHNRLDKHIADQLVYLNPNSKNIEVLYQSNSAEKIIYGTLEYVIVYQAESNIYRYISLINNSVIHEVESNIDPDSGDYAFYLYEKENVFEVIRFYSLSGKEPVIDSLSLSPP